MSGGPFFETVFSLTSSIFTTGTFLFRSLFYSIEDWLNLQPGNGLLSWLSGIAELIGLDWFIEYSFVDLIFSPAGIWIIFTMLLVYFVIP